MDANPDDKQWITGPEAIVPRETLPGGGITISPSGQVGAANRAAGPGANLPWGSKMPLSAIPKAEEAIKAAKQAVSDKQEGSFLGVSYSQWRSVGIYAVLLLLFLLGVWGLLGSSPLSVTIAGGRKSRAGY